jgi:predicted phage tail protein
MEIPVHATTRTRVGVPTTKPVATVDTSRRLSHIIDFRDADKPRSTATPYLTDSAGADAGKTAHYWLRWVNTRGEAGPWSDTISATIPG